MQPHEPIPDPNVLAVIAIMVTVFLFGTIIAVSVTWLQSRPKMRAIDLLRAYAEKGQEPPASVIEAIGRLNWPFPTPPPARRPTRADHLAHLAGALVLAAGSGALAWWRIADGDPGSPLPIVAIIVAIFFAGSAAARMVGALTARDGDR